MKLVSGVLGAAPLISTLFTSSAYAQKGEKYTDADTGIEFWQYTIPDATSKGGFQLGMALPPEDSASTDEYIGHMVGALQDGAGWSGISHGGGMTSRLLLIAWADGDKVRTSFRYATGYTTPKIYTGNATLTEIASSVNETHFSLTYRCQWCWYWDQDGTTGSSPPTGTTEVMGWVQAMDSPEPPSAPTGTIGQHDNGMGQFGLQVASARNPSYTEWASKATPTTTPGAGNGTQPTATATCVGSAVPTGTSYDYIVVGAGAGGVPLADKLSEAGKSVLLIERGPPSSGRWIGDKDPYSNWRPEWLEGTNLTRFDVPGLYNQVWKDSANIACDDLDVMAGCLLGGGTSVNAALWWRAPAIDWDYNFPEGWKSTDMQSSVDRVFERIPGTDHPSMDGEIYKQEGFKVISSALSAAGWKSVTANEKPDEKSKTFAHTPYMYQNGERDGPLATYLVTASKRDNFKLWTNTGVRRVIREGGHVTGVELESSVEDGHCGIVNVTATTGRVILSAGALGTPKILFRSGIGPEDQLKVVNGSSKDGATMIDEAQWINLPVGHNLNDHTNTDVVIKHKNVSYYDYDAVWKNPVKADTEAYLNNRTGILTQASPNIGPMIWDTVEGSDGITRQLQYTARVESSLGVDDHQAMTISQYLGRGSTSRGVLTITSGLTMSVSTAPYLRTDEDKAAVIQGIKTLKQALSKDPSIVFLKPDNGTSVEDFVNDYTMSVSSRTANHWTGTTKMGTDSGLTGGTAVIDTDTRVYGTDNLYVVDASVFPGMMSTNPSALIVSVAERASERILAQADLKPIEKYGQCSGLNYKGSRVCAEGLKCTQTDNNNRFYAQCM